MEAPASAVLTLYVSMLMSAVNDNGPQLLLMGSQQPRGWIYPHQQNFTQKRLSLFRSSWADFAVRDAPKHAT